MPLWGIRWGGFLNEVSKIKQTSSNVFKISLLYFMSMYKSSKSLSTNYRNMNKIFEQHYEHGDTSLRQCLTFVGLGHAVFSLVPPIFLAYSLYYHSSLTQD